MTLIRGATGWMVVDPLMDRETADAAFALVEDSLGAYPVSAVIFTRSHVDHFGGIAGVLDRGRGEGGRREQRGLIAGRYGNLVTVPLVAFAPGWGLAGSRLPVVDTLLAA